MSNYIIVEGPDKVGKSTLVRMLARRYGWLATKEPGGTGFGKRLSTILRNPDDDLHTMEQVLLFMADRFRNMREVVVPALANNVTVIQDRSDMSTHVYQQNVSPSLVAELGKLAIDDYFPGIEPTIRIVLVSDLPKCKLDTGAWERDGLVVWRNRRDRYRFLTRYWSNSFSIDVTERDEQQVLQAAIDLLTEKGVIA
jgi:thymidylate kinase